jgi:hypothetical protein
MTDVYSEVVRVIEAELDDRVELNRKVNTIMILMVLISCYRSLLKLLHYPYH